MKRKVRHSTPFTAVKDSRNRKVRGLWRRGQKWYMQTKVAGDRSARRVPLAARTLEAAKAEMADVRKQKGAEGLADTGLRPLFSDYADAYLKFHKAANSGKKPRTVAREGHSLVHWKKSMGNVRLDKITKPMIFAFVKARLEAGVTPRTANLDVIMLRNVLKQAQEEGLIRRLPMEGLKPRKVKTPVRQLLTPEQFQKLCKAAEDCGKNGRQLSDYVRLLAYSGARRDEALALKWEHVDSQKRHLRIGADGLFKNSTERYVDFNSELEAHLRDMEVRRAPDSEWLFPSPRRGEKDRAAKTLRESFKTARKACELDWVGFHDLRHFFISLAVMTGIDTRTIADWVGHKDGGVLIGRVYAHLLPDHRRQMAQKLKFALPIDDPPSGPSAEKGSPPDITR